MSPSFEVDFSFDVECASCGTKLDAQADNRRGELSVEPCSVCLAAARSEGYDERDGEAS